MKKVKITCDICNNSDWFTFGKMLIKCKHCELVRANEIYSDKKLASLYQHDYYFGNEYNNYIKDRPALEKNFKERIKYLKKKKYLHKGSNVIEIGSAYGFFLNLMKRECKSIIGFDVTEEGVRYAKENFNVNAICGNFLDFKGGGLDLVCMWDVIEHLSNPSAFINKISKTLLPGGKLILTTGDISSLLARIQKNHWRMIHPPTHLYYFDKKTIEHLLLKHGLKIVDIKYTVIYRNLGSVIIQIFKLQSDNIVRAFHLDRFNFGINLFDIMEVTAIKL